MREAPASVPRRRSPVFTRGGHGDSFTLTACPRPRRSVTQKVLLLHSLRLTSCSCPEFQGVCFFVLEGPTRPLLALGTDIVGRYCAVPGSPVVPGTLGQVRLMARPWGPRPWHCSLGLGATRSTSVLGSLGICVGYREGTWCQGTLRCEAWTQAPVLPQAPGSPGKCSAAASSGEAAAVCVSSPRTRARHFPSVFCILGPWGR